MPKDAIGASGYWEWSIDDPDCWIELARFVVPDLLPTRARVASHDAITADRLSGRVARLDAVWKQFAELNIPYQLPPWVAGGRQRLRDPELVMAEGGTCIDLVLTFAAMCLAGGLRPYLVVDPAYSAEEGHALVGVDIDSGLETASGSIWPEPVQVESLRRSSVLTREQLGKTVLSGAVMLLDCTNAARDLKLALAKRGVDGRRDASHLARSFLDHESTGEVPEWKPEDLAVIDVAAVQRHFPPHGLDRSKRPAITAQLPKAPRWSHYPSRECLIEDVLAGFATTAGPEPQGMSTADVAQSRSADGAWTILLGPAGTGKSRLAHEVATKFEGGSAWWLTSNDDRTLRRSLAAAQANESGRTIKDTDMAGREEEADAALARLRTSAMPWLVVLDNANCKPSDLRSRPRPRAHLGQRVLVTTLPEYEAGWRQLMPNANFIPVQALTKADLDAVGSGLTQAAREAAGGSALLVRAYTSLSYVYGVRLEEQLAATPGEGSNRLWRAFLGLAAPGEIEAAHRLSWLPPDGIPESIAGALAGRLTRLGLLTQSLVRSSTEPLYDLHRSIGSSARSTDPDPVGHILSLLQEDSDSYDHLDRFGDTSTLDEMAHVLLPAHRGGDPRPGLGPGLVYLAQLFELYGRVIARDTAPSAEELHIEASSRNDVQGLLLAECLHGRARAVNQDAKRNQPVDKSEEDHTRQNREREAYVDEALALIEQARALRQGNAKLVARSDAVLGLLQQKKARFLPAEQRADLYIAAYNVLAHSRDERVAIIREERRRAGVEDEARLDLDAEIARARFNLAGAANDIASALPDTDLEGRAHYLAEARDTYDEVLTLRRALYGTARPHPHIVACVRGLGLIAYQTAWLVNTDKESRVASLRTAHDYLTQALTDDEMLDFEDGPDVVKSLFLLGKVSDRRLRLSAGEGRLSLMRSQADMENT
jgi:hypothetical protein